MSNLSDLTEYFLLDAQDAIEAFNELMQSAATDSSIDDEWFDTYEITAHGMKSALLNIGETELSASAKTLEFAAKDKDISTIKEKTPPFVADLKETVIKLEA